MSGGSHDYLYLKADSDAEEIGSSHAYQRMAAALAHGGYYDAASLTLLISEHLDSARRLAKVMSDVHKAQEWFDSGDWGAERVALAVMRLRAELKGDA